jgi:endonuclease III
VSTKATRRVLDALVERHGQTYAAEAGISMRNTPAPLFRLLVLSLLLSARISAGIAVAAGRALADAGWTTPKKLAGSTWAERAKTLNQAGYARYDERTSTMLGAANELLLDRYHGDLRELRDEAQRDPSRERRELQQFAGIGAVGAEIFTREAQAVWDEMYPFAGDRALGCASRLGLGDDVAALERITSDPTQFTVVVAALVRCDLAGDHDEILAASKT